jgi:hypothetical protein
VVSVTDSYGRILDFIDRSRFFFQVIQINLVHTRPPELINTNFKIVFPVRSGLSFVFPVNFICISFLYVPSQSHFIENSAECEEKFKRQTLRI